MIIRYIDTYLYYIIALFVVCSKNITIATDIIYAVNCGGDDHIDQNGIPYKKDPLEGRIGTSSDYGKRLLIGRVPPRDQILYQTERFHEGTFGYNIPLSEDGDYVLVLKFSEVYFNAVDKKVFDVVLNSYHTIVSNLDIFERVGRGVAHDEYVPFTILNGHLLVNNGEESQLREGTILLEFIKGYRDNPKVNAFFVLRGTLNDVPLLPSIEREVPEEEPYKEQVDEDVNKNRRTSGPVIPDPYGFEDSSMMLPVFIAVGAFIPILFCLCKL